MQTTTRKDTGPLAGLVGVDKLIGQPQFVTEFEAGRFLRQEGIGPRLRHEIADPMGDDLASPGGAGIDHRAADRDTGSRRPFVKGIGSRETGDPSTDDGDGAEVAHDVGQREDSCAVSTEASVSRRPGESFSIAIRSSWRP